MTLKSTVFVILVIYLQSQSTSGNNDKKDDGKLNPWDGGYSKLIINEINTDSSSPTDSLFLELRKINTRGRRGRPPANTLSDFYILIVRGDTPSVVFYLDLNEKSLSFRQDGGFLVVGEDGVPNVNIKLSHREVRTIYKNDPSKRLLPAGDEAPFAVMLLHAKNKRALAKRFNLWQDSTGRFNELKLTPELIRILQELLADMVVFGRKCHASGCLIFDSLWPKEFPQDGDNRYILRDWDVADKPDLSLNRCAVDDDPFQTNSFKYGAPTPGHINDCTGKQVFAEEIIDEIAPQASEDVQAIPSCSASMENVPAGRYSLIDAAAFAERRDTSSSEYAEEADKGRETVTQVQQIIINNAVIQERGGEAVAVDLIVKDAFYAHWIGFAKDYLPNQAAIMTEGRVMRWLRVNTEPSNNVPLTFYCDVCTTFFGTGDVDVSKKRPMSTPEGYFSSKPYKNQEEIENHMADPVHLAALKFSLKMVVAKTEEELQKTQRESEAFFDMSLETTMQMIRTVFTEIQAEVSFIYHELFVDLQAANGIDVGFRHYSKVGASLITNSLSTSMHKMLLTHLVDHYDYITLLVDASTSKRNVPYLLVYIQAVEDGFPIIYYYRIIELEEGESSRAIFNSFWKSVVKDNELVPGFQQFMLQKIGFFVSDNAAAMVGSQQSFLTELRQMTEREVPNIGCMAHKMSLVLKSAIRDRRNINDLQFIRDFEGHINDLYMFYNSRGSKRFQHFAEVAEKYEMKTYRFKKNIEVRWAQGEFEVVDVALKNYDAALQDLGTYETMKGIDAHVKAKAKTLLSYLTDFVTVVLFHEFHDFLTINKILSKTFQEAAGILLDHHSAIINTIKSYKNHKEGFGVQMKKFIKDTECPETCLKGQCTIEELDDCPRIFWKNRRLLRELNPTLKYHVSRQKLYDNMIEATEKYFSINLIRSMRIFDNRLFTTQSAQENFDGDFNTVCEFIMLPNMYCDGVRNEYVELRDGLLNDAFYSSNFNSLPSEFWPFVLQTPWKAGSPIISDSIRKILGMLLIMSDSSAEVERRFSFFTRILQGPRSNLQTISLDSLLRIRINSPKPVSDFKVKQYARDFLKEHIPTDDSTSGGLKRDSYSKQRSKRVYSRIF